MMKMTGKAAVRSACLAINGSGVMRHENNGKRDKEDGGMPACHLCGCGGRFHGPFILYDE